jgi:hypothetical protein
MQVRKLRWVDDSGLEELGEATVAALVQAGHTASIQATRALDGAIRIGSAETADELFSSVQRLCFEGASALLVVGAVVDYPHFSSNAKVLQYAPTPLIHWLSGTS